MSSADVIILNVGGTRLKTTRMTLMADSKSLLAKMFELNSTFSPSKLEDGGAYFIDADPEFRCLELTGATGLKKQHFAHEG